MKLSLVEKIPFHSKFEIENGIVYFLDNGHIPVCHGFTYHHEGDGERISFVSGTELTLPSEPEARSRLIRRLQVQLRVGDGEKDRFERLLRECRIFCRFIERNIKGDSLDLRVHNPDGLSFQLSGYERNLFISQVMRGAGNTRTTTRISKPFAYQSELGQASGTLTFSSNAVFSLSNASDAEAIRQMQLQGFVAPDTYAFTRLIEVCHWLLNDCRDAVTPPTPQTRVNGGRRL